MEKGVLFREVSSVSCSTVELSNLDTNGAEESVQFSEVSSFQRLKCMHCMSGICTWGGKRCPV